MVQRPEQKIAYFALDPRDFVTVHAESTPHVHKALAAIRAQGARAGLALNPATPLEACRWVLDDLDLLLIMTINPGFAGQKLVAQTLEKLRSAREMLDAAGSAALLAVDGNVSFENAKTMSQCGADVFVAGTSSLYAKGNDLAQNYEKLRRAIAEGKGCAK